MQGWVSRASLQRAAWRAHALQNFPEGLGPLLLFSTLPSVPCVGSEQLQSRARLVQQVIPQPPPLGVIHPA